MFKFFITSFGLLCLLSCKTGNYTSTSVDSIQVTVPMINTKVEYKDRVVHDSTYIHDSIYMYIKGDTVYKYKERTYGKYLNGKDTVILTDTIKVPVEVTKIKKETVTETVEVNKILWWQKVLMWVGLIVFMLGVVYLTDKLKKFF